MTYKFKKWRNKDMNLGGLSLRFPVGCHWDDVNFSPTIGYYLYGPYGDLRNLPKKLGRIYMRGLASPTRF